MLSQLQYEEGTLVLPKKFDYSKSKPLGGYTLRSQKNRNGSGSFGSIRVFLMQYGRKIVYIPDMTLKELKNLSPKIFKLVAEWFPFRVTSYDVNSSLNFSTVYHSHLQELLPDYEFEDKEKAFYNILSFRNQSKKKGYYIAYGFNQVGETNYLREGLYQNKELISPSILPFNNYDYALYKEGKTHIIVNMNTNDVFKTNELDTVVEITDNHIVGVNEKEEYNYESYYYYKVIRKSDGQILYKDSKGHHNNGTWYGRNYRLIGDRYLVVESYVRGMLDLKTGKRIQYPFENTCENFICDVTDTTFTDEKGTHNLSELPDLSWTGYNTLEFIKKFNGFIPHKQRTGYMSLDGTGAYGPRKSSILVFGSISRGLFYKKRNELVNLMTDSSHNIDDVMLSWIKKNENVYIFDKAPKDTKRFSFLQPLKEGKIINELYFEYNTLYRRGGGKTFKTNFLREEINFTTKNIIDIMCNLNGTEPKLEIVCNVKDKKVTFETKIDSSKFEVANIE